MATQKSTEVKSKQNVVGEATYMEYENVAEAVAAIGEATILTLINAQIRTNAMNQVRAGAVGKPSAAAIRMEALASCSTEELVSCAQDKAKLEELLNRKVAEIKAKQSSPVTAAAAEDDED